MPKCRILDCRILKCRTWPGHPLRLFASYYPAIMGQLTSVYRLGKCKSVSIALQVGLGVNGRITIRVIATIV